MVDSAAGRFVRACAVVRQWHNEIDPEFGESVADTIDGELAERLAEHHLTTTDLDHGGDQRRPPADEGPERHDHVAVRCHRHLERVGADDYVLRLTDSTNDDQHRRGADQYGDRVAAGELPGRDRPRRRRLSKDTSRAAYLTGSFGSGKSYFMACCVCAAG